MTRHGIAKTRRSRPLDVEAAKQVLRARMLQQLKTQREDVRRRKSNAIWRQVRRLTAFRRAATVCCYVALPYEVQTWQMIEGMLAQGKRVVVPIVSRRSRVLRLCEIREPDTELVPGAFGVLEPRRGARRTVPGRRVDLVLVPGLAFDRRGGRLGHGHGYFDRLLARLPGSTKTVGLAFRSQLFDRLPTSLHDYTVHRVLTA
ncbi:MAG TPA: 5-formyltetrahydrofolate cyclo-ligase [bacterium]